MTDYIDELYFEKIAAAFIKGQNLAFRESSIENIMTKSIGELSKEELNAIIEFGKKNNLKLYKFKHKTYLPRIKKVLGIIKNIYPQRILDIGSGRGTFLWPLIYEFPYINITSIDISKIRVDDINAVNLGGIKNVQANKMDSTNINFPDKYFEVVTALEVLEHISDYEKAIWEILRVADKFVIISVPSKEDNNPEHINLFTENLLQSIFAMHNLHKVDFSYVHNHIIVIVRK